ncbi:sulfurtransferase [Salinivibrio sp. ML323]|uniref:rhodanese-like domain-containing protein n=1 Tax=Salinivibrio TaxID=51366 RepID=UPI000987867D|nr:MULTISPECIES: rhodanese-like domain-containing protein [Salinivibrio]OOE59349.1 sulfurtransferase [Salinivibrio sp. ML323]OOE60209.1 sulfurtransferase [Salinivibrio sp. IB282]WBA19558.1 rhodanese-like domain-containing protein [Salinivibrio kushneri]
MSVFVTAEWLAQRLDTVIPVDASWFMPDVSRDGFQEWQQRRIPGAVYFDFDGRIKDSASSLPHMLPDEDSFAHQMGALGIASQDTLVVYDTQGLFSAARAWWMCKVMGHQDVFILNGGLPAWMASEGLIDNTPPQPRVEATYQTQFKPYRYMDGATLADKLAVMNVIDVRPETRFYGDVPEPREGVRSGHMPGATNLPFANLTDPRGFVISEGEARTILLPHLSDTRVNVASCGSGVTACILAAVAEHYFAYPVAVYDGSWTEWGGHSHWPVVKAG